MTDEGDTPNLQQPQPIDTGLLWDFRCTCRQTDDGKYRVRLTGRLTGEVRESIGAHPIWELIRLLGLTDVRTDCPK